MPLGTFIRDKLVESDLILPVVHCEIGEHGDPELEFIDLVYSGNFEEQMEAMFYEWLTKNGLQLQKVSGDSG